MLEKCLLPGVPRCNWKKNIKETKNQVVKFQNLIIFSNLWRNLGKHRCSFFFFPPKAMLHTEIFLTTKKSFCMSPWRKKKITQRSWKSHLFWSPTTSYPSTCVSPREVFVQKPPRQSSQHSRQSTNTLQTIMVALRALEKSKKTESLLPCWMNGSQTQS